MAQAVGGPGDPELPNLISYPAENFHFTQDDGGDLADGDDGQRPNGTRLLLRFDGSVYNAGPGPLEAWHGSDGTTFQRIFKENGEISRDDTSRHPRIYYENADGHQHWHFNRAARYSLWNASRTAEVAPAMKVGFCLEDGVKVDGWAADSPYYPVGGHGGEMNFCKPGQTASDTVVQEGVSPGWRDQYGWGLSLQYVDLTNVQPGSYWMNTQVDPDNQVIETDENNPSAFSPEPIVVPGYLSTPVNAGTTPPGQAKAIALGSQQFGAGLGARRFVVTDPPDHGSLSVPPGAVFADPTVVYTPNAGYSGADAFGYVARDANNQFPHSAAAAYVAIGVGAGATAPAVTISGAPSRLVAGTSARLKATVTGDRPGVAWSVNGRSGGSRTYGTISTGGLYKAPAKVPKRPTVTITARSGSGATGSANIKIVKAGSHVASPLPSGPLVFGRSALARPLLGRFGNQLVIRSKAKRAGVVTITARKGSRGLGSCRQRVAKMRSFACRIHVSRRLVTRGVKVTLSLRSPRSRRLLAVRSSTFTKVNRAAGSANGLVCWLTG